LMFVLIFSGSEEVLGHERFWGECPFLKPMENFDWKRVRIRLR
jgi:hypothetical protein